MDRKVMGIAFIGVGVLLALGASGLVNFAWGMLWPLFILIPSAAFHIGYFSSRRPAMAGLLVPGGVLGVVGLLFLYLNLVGWYQMSFLWPVFILAPAVGLFELYLFGYQQPGLLIPVFILIVVAFVFLGVNLLHSTIGGVFGVALILVGLYVMFGKRKRKEDEPF